MEIKQENLKSYKKFRLAVQLVAVLFSKITELKYFKEFSVSIFYSYISKFYFQSVESVIGSWAQCFCLMKSYSYLVSTLELVNLLVGKQYGNDISKALIISDVMFGNRMYEACSKRFSCDRM